MKRHRPASLWTLLALGLVIVAVLVLTQPARALPEYSTQTGEPCATCHNSPSGGGLRTPRGQAWIGSHRPGTVPALNEALALLGVRLTVNEADFLAPPYAARPAGNPTAGSGGGDWHWWLDSYEGN